jgi:hypothetical protein
MTAAAAIVIEKELLFKIVQKISTFACMWRLLK